ncbi:hypothetical protein F7D01_13700 [Erythrobacter sp. 3-20A1M]|uniref:hypothetical protein n=1 Tax=Erythrobacter sp. 3-20A1M TaxID=2653850 RepID=UPI001BFCBAF2|nr:hypothetical protein [Erythrobacter sp. 3-20A1M]QWC57976.1 hypothetical protein F7D01_13700 [Erythrobacter sp. 3-20A1M]
MALVTHPRRKIMFNATRKGAADARARILAETLCEAAQLPLQTNLSVLFPAFHQSMHLPEPDLILLPTSADLPFARRWSQPLIREARCDLLLVSWPAGTMPAFMRATWSVKRTGWTAPLRLWMSIVDEPWFVTSCGPNARAFRLADARRWQSSPPFYTQAEMRSGFSRAGHWVETLDRDLVGERAIL